MILKLFSDIDLDHVKRDLRMLMKKGMFQKHYSFEISLIYKLIHEYSNYEEYQWSLYTLSKYEVERELKNLLISISRLDERLTWDCLSVFERYKKVRRREFGNKIDGDTIALSTFSNPVIHTILYCFVSSML